MTDSTKINKSFQPGSRRISEVYAPLSQRVRTSGPRVTDFGEDLVARGAGLRVKAKLDQTKHPTGVKISNAAMKSLSLRAESFRRDWNHELAPRES